MGRLAYIAILGSLITTCLSTSFTLYKNGICNGTDVDFSFSEGGCREPECRWGNETMWRKCENIPSMYAGSWLEGAWLSQESCSHSIFWSDNFNCTNNTINHIISGPDE